MTDDPRVEALRLATAFPAPIDETVKRAAAYHAFLTDRTVTLEVKVDASQATEEIAKVAEAVKQAKPAAKAKEAPPPPPPPAEEPADEAGEYTIDQVRAALKEYRSIEGAPAMLEVLKTHGGSDQLTSVDPANYSAIMAAIKAD